MKLKDRLLLTAASLALGWLLVDAKPIVIGSASKDSTLVIDTIKHVKPQDTIVDVNGKRAFEKPSLALQACKPRIIFQSRK